LGELQPVGRSQLADAVPVEGGQRRPLGDASARETDLDRDRPGQRFPPWRVRVGIGQERRHPMTQVVEGERPVTPAAPEHFDIRLVDPCLLEQRGCVAAGQEAVGDR
jgi:hypothetical protein